MYHALYPEMGLLGDFVRSLNEVALPQPMLLETLRQLISCLEDAHVKFGSR